MADNKSLLDLQIRNLLHIAYPTDTAARVCSPVSFPHFTIPYDATLSRTRIPQIELGLGIRNSRHTSTGLRSIGEKNRIERGVQGHFILHAIFNIDSQLWRRILLRHGALLSGFERPDDTTDMCRWEYSTPGKMRKGQELLPFDHWQQQRLATF